MGGLLGVLVGRLVGRLSLLALLGITAGCAQPAPPQEPKARSFAEQPDGAPGEIDPAWWTRARQQLGAREYWVSDGGEGLQAPNRAHALRPFFDGSGIRVHDRRDAGGEALVALRLAGLGRGGERRPVTHGRVAHAGARVEISRPGGLSEWYENRPGGLEQGFTLSERPAGRGALELELALEGASAEARGDAELVLTTLAGRALRFGALRAFDARGASVPALFRVDAPGRIVVAVDDAGARYPLTVDPLLTAPPDGVLSGDDADGRLGWRVASAGDVDGDGYDDVIVGAWFYDDGQTNEGAAFVFHGSASGIADGGSASADARIQSDQGTPGGAQLGLAVASAGDVDNDGYSDVIVGSNLYDSGQNNEGAAFVFHGGPGGVGDRTPASADARLEADQSNAQMGWSVASAGDVNNDGYDDVIVSAYLYDNGENNEGLALVFHGGAGGVGNGNPGSADALIESDQLSGQLGLSVASAGDVNDDGYADVIVGCHLCDAGETDEGLALIFHGSPGGVGGGNPASADGQIESNRGASELGLSVASAGDVDSDGFGDVIVGAPRWGSFVDAGAAFVFRGSASGVGNGNPDNALVAIEGNDDFAQLGVSVAAAGDVNGDRSSDVIVGAHAGGGGGQAFVYLSPAPEPGAAALSVAAALALLVLRATNDTDRRRPRTLVAPTRRG